MITASIVAMFGAIMAAPLAAPEIRTLPPPILTSFDVSFANVSVVIMAVAPSLNAESDPLHAAIAEGISPVMRSIGSGTPMMPVEHTRICSGTHPSCSATADVMTNASR